MLKVENLKLGYDNVPVIFDVSLEVHEKEVVSIVGSNGAGKSTILKMIVGQLSPDAGTVVLTKGKTLGYLAQHQEMESGNTIYEEVRTAKAEIIEMEKQIRTIEMELPSLSGDALEARLSTYQRLTSAFEHADGYAYKSELTGVLKGLGFTEEEFTKPVDSLSGGQKTRVSLGKLLLTKPDVLLLDEPLSAIDAKLRKSLQISIKQITKKLGLTAIFVTHDQDEAMVMSDVINLFHEGRIEQSGDPVSVYTKPVSSFAASFIGNYNQITSEQFQTMTGTAKAGEVAIRPETFSISSAPIVNDEEYHFEGIIEDNMPRGNVLRYQINVNGVKLHADVLFRSRVLFDNGDKVYMSVAEHNCISL